MHNQTLIFFKKNNSDGSTFLWKTIKTELVLGKIKTKRREQQIASKI